MAILSSIGIPGSGLGILHPLRKETFMKEELFEALVFQYPAIFEKAELDDIYCGNGWYGLLEGMFESIYSKLEDAKSELNFWENEHRNFPSVEHANRLAKAEQDLKEALATLPVFQQIKEKFGTLRIYAYNISERDQAFIDMATSMANRICENCGSAGKQQDTGKRWACYCDDCVVLSKKMIDGILPSLPIRKVAPKFIET